MDTEPRPRSAESVADQMWERVRALSATVKAYEAVAAEQDLDESSQRRLDRARIRLIRAADRARLADDLSDQLAEQQRQATRRRT